MKRDFLLPVLFIFMEPIRLRVFMEPIRLRVRFRKPVPIKFYKNFSKNTQFTVLLIIATHLAGVL